MKKFSLFAVASLLLLAGCSESDDNLATDQSKTIEFRSVVDKTRASLVGSTLELENFFVVGKQVAAVGGAQTDFMSASVYREGAELTSPWTYAPKKYWPTNGETVNFYAFAPYSNAVKSSLAVNGTSAQFSYIVPADQSGQNTAVDLLVAGKNGNSGSVAFEFKHALSAVTFSATNSNSASSELVYTISKIEIIKIDNTGTYNYLNGWTPATTKNVTYTAGVPKSGVAVQPGAGSVNLLSANDVMMMLPQTTTNDAKVVITYSLKDGGGASVYDNATKTLDFPASFAFAVGTRYNFAFAFDASSAIEFTVAVADWSPESIVGI